MQRGPGQHRPERVKGRERTVRLSNSRVHPAQATTWRTLDGPAVSRPFNLLALMTSAPRWNTHALIALAGPLHIQPVPPDIRQPSDPRTGGAFPIPVSRHSCIPREPAFKRLLPLIGRRPDRAKLLPTASELP